MKTRHIALGLAAFIPAFAFAQATPPAATTLPANVQADIAKVQQDATALRAAVQQLRSDQESGSAAVAADRSAIAIAHLQLRLDAQQLRIDAAPIIQADEAALMKALTQLHADQVANNASAIGADQQAVHAAQQQLMTDARALHAGGGHGKRMHGPGSF